MPRQIPPDLSIALTILRSIQGWRQTELAEATGIPQSLLSDYEHGRKKLARKRLETIIATMGLPPETIEMVLACVETGRAMGRGPRDPADRFSETRRRIEAISVGVGGLTTNAVRDLLSLLTFEAEGLRERELAGSLWDRLKRRSPQERLALVEDPRQNFLRWAVCERVAAESIEAAATDPNQALGLAKLALRIAELLPADQTRRWRAQGYAGMHVSNALRICGELPTADRTFARAKKLWEAGAPGAPGFLNEAVVLGLEATLRQAQRRFSEALARIDDALVADRGDLRARLLYTKARILGGLGDFEGSTAALREAASLIDGKREPRLALGVRFEFLVNLCLENRATEAETKLGEVQELAERSGKELDLVRMVWLKAKIHAGLGRTAEAIAAFEQVRREFTTRKIAYDYALVSLELSVVLLEQNRTAEVRTLAAGMVWIFRAQGVHQEALAALKLFCEAAQRETATVELARKMVRYLFRAQQDPELRFEAEEGAEAR